MSGFRNQKGSFFFKKKEGWFNFQKFVDEERLKFQIQTVGSKRTSKHKYCLRFDENQRYR